MFCFTIEQVVVVHRYHGHFVTSDSSFYGRKYQHNVPITIETKGTGRYMLSRQSLCGKCDGKVLKNGAIFI